MDLNIFLSAQTDAVRQAFNPDHIVVYLMAAFLISVFVLLFYNRIYVLKEQDAKLKSQSMNGRLALVLQTGNLRLWLYDVPSRHYILLSETGEYEKEYNPVEFSEFYSLDDFEHMRKEVFDICEGRSISSSVTLRSNPKKRGKQSYYEIKLSIAEKDAKGKVKSLLGVQHDVTDVEEKKQKVAELLMRYHTVFNSSLVDMLYYDADGVLRDINDKACRTFKIANRELMLQKRLLLKDNPFFNDVDFAHLRDTRATAVIDFKDFQDERYQTKVLGFEGKMYYESTINPIRDEQGRLEGIYMAGRNVTEMVNSYHRQQEGAQRLRQANKNIQNYINNINYALRVSNVRLINYFPDSYTLEVSDDVNAGQLKLSQLRCIRLATPRFRRTVSSMLNRMDHRTSYLIQETIETEIRDKKGRQIWMMFNLVPLKNSEGRVVRYFGLCRNMTDMVETERRLAVETKKAQETELLKQSFLTNMSYEIRTPLNTVVGFAELFEAEHDPADEAIFVEEIKRNSNSLLELVNDILFLSRLDANMEEYNRYDIDFALIFDSHCQMGWSGVSPNVKTIVENPYEHLVVNIDLEHLGKVIGKLCMNAVNYTQEGFIRAKYEYRHGELTISIEDTGKGVDQKILPHVFERFARDEENHLCGTGLDLAIVQQLVVQMGGNIEIQSEVGKGTTFWVTVPCEAKSIEMKREI